MRSNRSHIGSIRSEQGARGRPRSLVPSRGVDPEKRGPSPELRAPRIRDPSRGRRAALPGTPAAEGGAAVKRWVVGRRRVLQWIGSAACTSALPSVYIGCSRSSPQASYFSDADAAVLGALADAIIPPDDAPGGSALGAVNYIATLLTAFDHDPPLIYAGGPNSGRAAVPVSSGGAFGHIPAGRLLELPSARSVPDEGVAASHLRVVRGARRGAERRHHRAGRGASRRRSDRNRRRSGSLMPASVAPADLTQAQKTTMLGGLDRATLATLIELVLEGAFTAPEYGGNPGDRLADGLLRGRLATPRLQLVRPGQPDVHRRPDAPGVDGAIRAPTRCPWTPRPRPTSARSSERWAGRNSDDSPHDARQHVAHGVRRHRHRQRGWWRDRRRTSCRRRGLKVLVLEAGIEPLRRPRRSDRAADATLLERRAQVRVPQLHHARSDRRAAYVPREPVGRGSHVHRRRAGTSEDRGRRRCPRGPQDAAVHAAGLHARDGPRSTGTRSGRTSPTGPSTYDMLEPFYTYGENGARRSGARGREPIRGPAQRPFPMPPGVPMYVALLVEQGARVARLHGVPVPDGGQLEAVRRATRLRRLRLLQRIRLPVERQGLARRHDPAEGAALGQLSARHADARRGGPRRTAPGTPSPACAVSIRRASRSPTRPTGTSSRPAPSRTRGSCSSPIPAARASATRAGRWGETSCSISRRTPSASSRSASTVIAARRSRTASPTSAGSRTTRTIRSAASSSSRAASSCLTRRTITGRAMPSSGFNGAAAQEPHAAESRT